jgi:hypothetical protein
VKKLVLRAVFSGKKLNVINEQHVGRFAVSMTKVIHEIGSGL